VQDNAKLIADIYSAFSRGDTAFIVGVVSDDVDWNNSKSPEIPYGGHYSGPAGVRTFFDRIARTVGVNSFNPQAYITSGDAVIVAGSWSGTATRTGKAFESDWLMHWIITDGKVSYLRVYEDTALTAAAMRT
jgi:uncharacterized protein